MTNQNNKIYTFEIQYNGIDSFSTIQFCAHSKNEAIELFNDWCRNDNHTEPVTIESIHPVYDEDDAIEYGTDYGMPESYTE